VDDHFWSEILIILRNQQIISHYLKTQVHNVFFWPLAGEKIVFNCFVPFIPPGPPDAPSVTNITVNGKQCSLQWSKPYNGESPIVMYTVYIWVFTTTQGLPNKERVNSWNTTESHYTKDLEWAQNYTVSVSAWNRYGESSPGLERNLTTGQTPQGNLAIYLTNYRNRVWKGWVLIAHSCFKQIAVQTKIFGATEQSESLSN